MVDAYDKADASCDYASAKASLCNRSIEDILLDALGFYLLRCLIM